MKGHWIALFVVATGVAPLRADKLTDDDRKSLEKFRKESLVDPTKAVRVVISCRDESGRDCESEAWRVAGKRGQPDRLVDVDGAPIPWPDQGIVRAVDFVAACREKYANELRHDRSDPNRALIPDVTPAGTSTWDLVLAAWLLKLGEEDLAARALACDPDAKQLTDRFRHYRLEQHARTILSAFQFRRDDEARALAKFVLKTYARTIDEEVYGQIEKVESDLRRRMKSGETVGKERTRPADFATWSDERAIRHLIECLDDCSGTWWEALVRDEDEKVWPIDELVARGDRAVPALLDAIEHDDRLTRCVIRPGRWQENSTVVPVRALVEQAFQKILRVREQETRRPEAVRSHSKSDIATQRAYWKEYGQRPFDERMMSILMDSSCSFAARREAACNLAKIRGPGSQPPVPLVAVTEAESVNPVIAKFHNPTVAEAILKCRVEEREKITVVPTADVDQSDRQEHRYRAILKLLGDGRSAAHCARLSNEAEEFVDRRDWAHTAHELGDSSALESFAKRIAAGTLDPPTDTPHELVIAATLELLVAARLDATERTLQALAKPEHPWHAKVQQAIVDYAVRHCRLPEIRAHPIILSILTQMLDDESFTGRRFHCRNDQISISSTSGQSASPLPDYLAEAERRRACADERVCDLAALTLSDLVFGLPVFNVLALDADERRAAIHRQMRLFADQYRVMSPLEKWVLQDSSAFRRDVPPLGRAATAKDVAAGNALFHRNGVGKPIDLALPAVAKFPADAQGEFETALVVQAEQDPNGRRTYGLLTRRGVRVVGEKDLVEVKPLADVETDPPRRRTRRDNVKIYFD